MTTISTIIITKNEASQIRQCLESVQWTDEIIVLDSGSEDSTPEICKAYTTNVTITDWPGYGPQKNRALEKATSDWVLSIDADEIVTQELQSEIKQIMSVSNDIVAYSIPRLSKYCGRFIRYGDWKNDRCIRLFKRGEACFKEVPVHESILTQGPVGHLKHYLIHDTFQSLEDVLNKINEYSSLTARKSLQDHKKGSLTKALLHSGWTFLRGYIFKLGFLDGREGFLLAVSNAQGCYYRYLKLMYLQSLPPLAGEG